MAITERRATVEDLYRTEHKKAELVNGRLEIREPAGDAPSSAAGSIFARLLAYQRTTGSGRAYADGAGFLVDLPNRQSFGPDAAFHTGPRTGLKLLDGAPIFAVEVRSEYDYGRAPEREMLAKRADYFAAGTLVVWDVDLLAAAPIKVYRDGNADTPAASFRRGELADAEPALPGWRFPVDELFD